MRQYLDLLSEILEEGVDVPTGAYLSSEGRQPHARMILAAQFRYDLTGGFPAVTTKKFYFQSMVKEMLWFLRGETNTRTLGCSIWDSWAGKNGRPEGECGPIYGEMWRRWPYPDRAEADTGVGDGSVVYGDTTVETFDQVAQVVRDLRAVRANPYDRARRRIILTGWNPPLIGAMGLPPCHTMSQFLPANGVLHCHCFWRSIDAPVGMPFNVAQYAFLTNLLCAVTGFTPGTLIASVTDLHVYDNQVDMVREQLARTPYAPPTLVIDPDVARLAPDLSVEQVRRLTPDMFRLDGYRGHPPLRCEVAV